MPNWRCSLPSNTEVEVSQRQIENTIPVLAVHDLNGSIAFYRDALGFEVEWNAGAVCSVARDRCSVMLRKSERPGNGTVWIGLANDSLFSTLEKSGVTFIQAPSNKLWAYEMTIADPDGNVVWLGTEPKAG